MQILAASLAERSSTVLYCFFCRGIALPHEQYPSWLLVDLGPPPAHVGAWTTPEGAVLLQQGFQHAIDKLQAKEAAAAAAANVAADRRGAMGSTPGTAAAAAAAESGDAGQLTGGRSNGGAIGGSASEDENRVLGKSSSRGELLQSMWSEGSTAGGETQGTVLGDGSAYGSQAGYVSAGGHLARYTRLLLRLDRVKLKPGVGAGVGGERWSRGADGADEVEVAELVRGSESTFGPGSGAQGVAGSHTHPAHSTRASGSSAGLAASSGAVALGAGAGGRQRGRIRQGRGGSGGTSVGRGWEQMELPLQGGDGGTVVELPGAGCATALFEVVPQPQVRGRGVERLTLFVERASGQLQRLANRLRCPHQTFEGGGE